MPRSFYYDAERPNRSAPDLLYPGPEIDRRIPDDWTVWAFTDIHGMRDGLEHALRDAGLIDEDSHWIARPRTALVGVGDYIDRGPDSAGVIDLLRRLAKKASAAGGRVVLVRGNHEHMLSDILRGSPEWLGAWLKNGGDAFLKSHGPGEGAVRQPLNVYLERHNPDLLPWLLSTLPYAVWRDVLFVHAGPIGGGRLSDLEDADLQLWISGETFHREGLLARSFSGYRADGVNRVVVGHIPQSDGPTVKHGGTTLLLDTDACGLLGDRRPQPTAYVCLARIATEGDLGDSTFVLIEA